MFEEEKIVVPKISRPGKTARDRANGNQARTRSNRAVLGAWHKLSNSDKSTTAFPSHVCNGRKTRALRERPSSRNKK